MHKLFDYVNETGAMAVIGEIKAPPDKYDSVGELFQGGGDELVDLAGDEALMLVDFLEALICR